MKAVSVPDDISLSNAGEYEVNTGGMYFICPCGCGAMDYINFNPMRQPCSTWNNGPKGPTVVPSIERPCWKGSLVDGEWVSV